MPLKPRNAIPTVTSGLPPDMRRFVDRVRDVIGSGIETAELEAQDVIGVLPFDVEDDGTITVDDFRIRECPVTPPAPPRQLYVGEASNAIADPFEVRGIFENVILKWGGIPYGATRCHAYTEIWRSVVPTTVGGSIGDFSEAELVGTASGRTYVDPLGYNGKAWYWIRFVDYRGETGPFQDQLGVLAETAQDLEFILGVLTEQYGLSTAHPFFFVPDCDLVYDQWVANGSVGLPPECEPVVIGSDPTGANGITLDPGVYINDAFIGDATIVDAKIRDLSAEKLFAIEGTIATAIIDRGHINNLMIDNIIASNDYYGLSDDGEVLFTYPETCTWIVDKNGDARFRGIEIVDADGKIILSAGGIDGPFANPGLIEGFGNFAGLDQITRDDIDVYIEDGAITNAYIGNEIRSANWLPFGVTNGPRGWRMWKGDANEGASLTIADGTFYGTLNVGDTDPNSDTPTGTRIQNDVIQVLVDGVERVRIGKLT